MNNEDREWFKKLLSERLVNTFKMKYEDVVTKEPLFYGDFMIPNADVNIYCEITDEPKVRYLIINEYTNFFQ